MIVERCDICKFKEDCAMLEIAEKHGINVTCNKWEELETSKINAAVDTFALKLKERLAEKVEEGYAGWDQETCMGGLILELQDDARRLSAFQRKEIDIATRAMFIYFIRESVEAKIKEIADKE